MKIKVADTGYCIPLNKATHTRDRCSLAKH